MGDEKGKHCVPAYTSEQVSRVVLPYVTENLNMSTKYIRNIVMSRKSYQKKTYQSPFSFGKGFCTIRMEKNRAVEKASLEVYAQFLRNCGHRFVMYSTNGLEMKIVRRKAAGSFSGNAKGAELTERNSPRIKDRFLVTLN